MWKEGREGGRKVARTKTRGRDVRMGKNRVGENLMLVEEKEMRKKDPPVAASRAPPPPGGDCGKTGNKSVAF